MLRSLLRAPSGCSMRSLSGAGSTGSFCTASARIAASATYRQQPVSWRSSTSSALRRESEHQNNIHETAEPVSTVSASPSSNTTSEFVPRERFELPSTTPSWYAGHMARAIRSMPYLLARYPPPLVIEARDARIPLTSINPVFEKILKKAPTANDGLDELPSNPHTGTDASTWRSRRLTVYLKRDLIDPSVEAGVLQAMRERDPHQHVMFVDTRADADVKKVLHWVQKQARKIAQDDSVNTPPKEVSERAEKRAKKGLSGAFRHTPTPEEGVRLLILGMPNVGKSSLLNALRRVGTGKGKAASTAPHPGHTRKLTGTVRISKAGPSKPEPEVFVPGRRSARRTPSQRQEEDDDEAIALQSSSFMISSSDSEGVPDPDASPSTSEKLVARKDPPVYVYDTPGVMVPFLGHGAVGAERGIKLAITAGIKDSLFDVQLLADYLLFRLNLRPTPSRSGEVGEMPSYVRNLPLSMDEYLSTCDDAHGRTNSIGELLWHVAGKAPGSLRKGNIRDLDAAATFMLQHWRLGKLDFNTELDLNTTDVDEIKCKIHLFFQRNGDFSATSGVTTSTSRGLDHESNRDGQSRTQVKKQQKKHDVLVRKKKLMEKGISVGASSKSFKKSSSKGGKKKHR